VLTTQVDQVFYVEDERDPGWACAVRTKPRNVYDVGDEGHDDACANYHECEPLLLTSNNDHHLRDDFDHIQPDLDPIPVYVSKKKNLFEILKYLFLH